jgi:ABC-type multidrug transport system fused ATPase/permease subunit
MRVHLIPSGANTPVLAESSVSSSITATEQAGNTNIFLSLSSPIASSGSNLSQGQKQLLCLARAILSRPKVLLLDEATSAVDMATDRLIQRSIREEFANTTLLVIAHRLSTVADFDRILVMKDGVTLEFGSPKELLQDNGLFKEMVGHSGEKEELERIILEEKIPALK